MRKLHKDDEEIRVWKKAVVVHLELSPDLHGVRKEYHENFKMAKDLVLTTCIWETPNSTLGRDSDYIDGSFCGFSQCVQANTWIVER
jgi:hypothetical protein